MELPFASKHQPRGDDTCGEGDGCCQDAVSAQRPLENATRAQVLPESMRFDVDLLAGLSQLVKEPMLEFLIVCVFSHRRSFWSSLTESVNQVAEVRRFRPERPAARAMRRCPTPVIATAANREKSKK